MKKLSEKGRKVLRRIYSGLGAITVPFLFSACPPTVMYGMPPYEGQQQQLAIRGQVKSKKTGEAIPRIGIWLIRNTVPFYSVFTGTDGNFDLYMPKDDTTAIGLVFTDIDGGANSGLFKQHTINLTMEQCEALTEPLIIELEEEDAE